MAFISLPTCSLLLQIYACESGERRIGSGGFGILGSALIRPVCWEEMGAECFLRGDGGPDAYMLRSNILFSHLRLFHSFFSQFFSFSSCSRTAVAKRRAAVCEGFHWDSGQRNLCHFKLTVDLNASIFIVLRYRLPSIL